MLCTAKHIFDTKFQRGISRSLVYTLFEVRSGCNIRYVAQTALTNEIKDSIQYLAGKVKSNLLQVQNYLLRNNLVEYKLRLG